MSVVRPSAAILEGRMAARLDPNLVIENHELGFIVLEYGRLQESIESFLTAIRLNPKDPSRWNLFLPKGFFQVMLGHVERAIANFEEASRRRSSAFWAYVGVATANFGKGERVKENTAIAGAGRSRQRSICSSIIFLFGPGNNSR